MGISINAQCNENVDNGFQPVDGFQMAHANWILRERSILSSWRSTHRHKIPEGHDVLFMIVEDQSVPREQDKMTTYLVLKPSHKLGVSVDSLEVMRISDSKSTLLVESATVDVKKLWPILRVAWQWGVSADVDTQYMNLGFDHNSVIYMLVGEPRSNYGVGGLIMVEAVNPPDGGKYFQLKSDLIRVCGWQLLPNERFYEPDPQ